MTPAQAIQRLLDGFGGNQYDGEQIVVLDKMTRDGHLEFLIPHRYRLQTPEPSRN